MGAAVRRKAPSPGSSSGSPSDLADKRGFAANCLPGVLLCPVIPIACLSSVAQAGDVTIAHALLEPTASLVGDNHDQAAGQV